MTKTRLFQSNRSQAMRLPKDVAFPGNIREVSIVRDGVRRVVTPADAVWDDFFDRPGIDLEDRPHLPYQEREGF